MDWKKALKMVVGIPETAKGASELGEVPVGTEGTVELPAGEVKISYAESTDPPTENERMVFHPPEGFEVAVTPVGGGDPLEIKEPWSAMVGKAPGPVAWRTIGTVEVPAAGQYRITSGPASPDRNEPRLLLAPK
jgi:hypothetical protein